MPMNIQDTSDGNHIHHVRSVCLVVRVWLYMMWTLFPSMTALACLHYVADLTKK